MLKLSLNPGLYIVEPILLVESVFLEGRGEEVKVMPVHICLWYVIFEKSLQYLQGGTVMISI